MRWISSHKILALILAIAVIAVAMFAFSLFSGGKGNAVTSLLNSGISKVNGLLHGASSDIKGAVSDIFSYKELRERIDELENENAELKAELAENSLSSEQLDELERLAEILNYNYMKKKIEPISGDVISTDGSALTDVFMIDIGEEDGVEAGDAVVNGMGLVGKIKETGRGWSKVATITGTSEKVSFKLARSKKQLGICYGNSQGSVSGYMMEADSNVAAGDVIITSGMGIYPEGIEIGNVKSVKYNSDTLLKEIEIETSVNFKQIDKVAVLK